MVKKTDETNQKIALENITDMLGALVKVQKDQGETVKKLGEEITSIKTGGRDDFKLAAKAEDISKAKIGKEFTDPRIVKIVEETLGEDFKIGIEPNKERPGFMFNLIVPNRLSGLQKSTRPKMNPKATNPYARDYLKDETGKVIEEEYYPEDTRSRAISSIQSYDAIKQHCERVRANIVGYFQKMQKPIPEFRIKQSIYGS